MCPHLHVQHVATYRNGEAEAGYWGEADPRTHKVSLDPYRRESLKILAIFKEMIPKGEIAKIGRVAVLQPHRGQGVGRALMLAVVEHAAAAGFAEAVLDSQTYAVPFYQRLGFVEEGEQFMDGGIPHFRMRRRLVAVEADNAPAISSEAAFHPESASS